MSDALKAFERVLNDYNHGIYGNRTVKDSETDIETIRHALNGDALCMKHLHQATYWKTRYRLLKVKMAKKAKWQPIETAPTDGTFVWVVNALGNQYSAQCLNGKWKYISNTGFSTWLNPNPTKWHPQTEPTKEGS